MAVTYSDACKEDRLQAVIALVDAGASPGKLKIRDSSNTILVTFTLADPSGAATSGVLTFDVDPDIAATASATGTAANAIITDSADTTVISGLTVGTSGTDVIIDNTSITSGQTVTLTSGTITHA